MNAEEAHRFYADPSNLAVTGAGRAPSRPAKSAKTAIRFDPRMVEQCKALASRRGMTVSSFIREIVRGELERASRERPEGLIEGSERLGAPRWLPSTLTVAVSAGSAQCPHMSISNVTAVSCHVCGPLKVRAA